MRPLLLVATLGALAPAVAAAEAPSQKVGLLQIRVEGGADPAIGGQLTARLADALARRPGVSVLAPDDIRAMLEREATLQMLGCADDKCLVELGGALGADLLVQGRLTKLESRYALSLSVVSPADAAAVARASETWGGPSIGLVELVEAMVEQMFAGPEGPAPGALAVTGAPDGAQILVDDEVRGTAPAGQMGGLEVGAHAVQVVADGYAPFETWVVLRPGRTRTLPVALDAVGADRPVYATWWFWTIAGVAAAGAAAGTAVALSGGDEGRTGVNVSVNADTAFTGGR